MRATLLAALIAPLALLAACAAPSWPLDARERLSGLLPADIVLVGEQHDAADHQRIHHQLVEALTAQGKLAALALEMAPQGASTATLPRDADAAAVRTALHWDDKGWPWPPYAPAIMAAVRAGVPVVGANLPRTAMRGAMTDSSLDALLPGPALKTQQQAIRRGHCDLLPESQIAPMTRIQIARDRAIAQTLRSLRVQGKTVLLLAGANHVDRDVGVPLYLPADLRVKAIALRAGLADGNRRADGFDATWITPPAPPRDYCAGLRNGANMR